MDPSGIRRDVLRKLRAIPGPELAELSKKTTAAFLAKAGFLNGAIRVALFRAIPGEIDLAPIARELRARGMVLHYPRITDPNSAAMEFACIAEPDERHWVRGPYGTWEPAGHCPAADPGSLDLIFVPAVALGKRGERIGRGAGYYDRALPSAKSALRVSLAFDLQLFPSLPQNSWDQRLDWIFTQSRDIQLPRVAEWRKSRGL